MFVVSEAAVSSSSANVSAKLHDRHSYQVAVLLTLHHFVPCNHLVVGLCTLYNCSSTGGHVTRSEQSKLCCVCWFTAIKTGRRKWRIWVRGCSWWLSVHSGTACSWIGSLNSSLILIDVHVRWSVFGLTWKVWIYQLRLKTESSRKQLVSALEWKHGCISDAPHLLGLRK